MNIVTYLQEKGLLPAGNYDLRRLTGGFWNDVYALQGNGRHWAIKHFRAAHPANLGSLYPIFPQAELLALQTLSGLEIAPELVSFLPDGPMLVYEFFMGNVPQGDTAGIGRLLRRLHDLLISPDSAFRHLPLTPADILQQGDYLLAQAEPDDFVGQLHSLRPIPQPRPPLSRLSLIHTDAWVGNFVQNGRHLRLIDWQCPGLGDPTEDVWTFLYSGYELLLGQPRFTEQVMAQFWQGYGLKTAVATTLFPAYTYRLAAHCCLRQQQLAPTNPAASTIYHNLCAMHITNLWESRPSS